MISTAYSMSTWSKRSLCLSCLGLLLTIFFDQSDCQPLANIFVVRMYGANEVALYPGDPDGNGTAYLTFDYETNSCIFNVFFEKISEPERLQILFGDYRTASDQACVRLDLLKSRTLVKSPQYGYYQLSGAFPTTSSTINAILSTPANYFIEVKTRQFRHQCPGHGGPSANNAQYCYGALRGQPQNRRGGLYISYSNRNTENPP